MAARERNDILLYSSPRLLAELANVLARKKLSTAVVASRRSPEVLLQRYLQVARVVLGIGANNRAPSRITAAAVVLPLADGSARELRIRCVVRPDRSQAILLDRLGLKLPERLRAPQTVEM